MIPVQLIVAGAIAAASFGAAWTYQENKCASILAQYQTDHAIALAKATSDALARTVALQEKANAAQRKYNSRLADIRRDADSGRDAIVRLSEAADTALRRASDSHSACLADANTLTIVFGQCSTRLQDVAADADGLSAEVSLLRESWPK